MYSITNAITGHCNRNADTIESVPCKVVKVALAIILTLGVGAAGFSAIFFITHLLIPSLGASISIVVLLGGVDVCITICCQKRRDIPINLLGNPPPDVPNEGNLPIQSPADIANIQQSNPQVQQLNSQAQLAHCVIANEDLFYEIMKFLDIKKICKFAQVCKGWNVRIKNENAALWTYLAQNENYTYLPSNLISKRKQIFLIKQICLLSNLYSEESFSNEQVLVGTQFLLNNRYCFQRDLIIIKIFQESLNYANSFLHKYHEQLIKNRAITEIPVCKIIFPSYQLFKNYVVTFQPVFIQELLPMKGTECEIERVSDGKFFYFKENFNIGSDFYIFNDNLIWIEDKCINVYNIENKEIFKHTQSENFEIVSHFENKVVLISSEEKVSKMYIFDLDSKNLTYYAKLSDYTKNKFFINNNFLVVFQETESSTYKVHIDQYESINNMEIQKTISLNLPSGINCLALIENFLLFRKFVKSSHSFNGGAFQHLIIDLTNCKTAGDFKIDSIKNPVGK